MALTSGCARNIVAELSSTGRRRLVTVVQMPDEAINTDETK
jgi:hypothetical protein